MRLACVALLFSSCVALAAPIPHHLKETPNPYGKAILGVNIAQDGRAAKLYAKSPFKDCGGQVGDYFVKIGMEEIHSLEDVIRVMKFYRPGSKLKLEILRNKNPMTLEIVLGEEIKEDLKTFDQDFRPFPPKRPGLPPAIRGK